MTNYAAEEFIAEATEKEGSMVGKYKVEYDFEANEFGFVNKQAKKDNHDKVGGNSGVKKMIKQGKTVDQISKEFGMFKDAVKSMAEELTEKLDVKWDKDKEGWFDKQGKRRYLGKGATTDLMRKAIDKAKASGDWIKPFDLQHGQRPEEKEIEMKKENKYFDTKSGSIEDSIKQMYQLESTEVTVNRKELDKLVKQYIAKGGTVTKLPPALSPDEDPDPKRKAYKVKKVGNTYKILKASLREFIKTYNEHFLTNYAAEEFIAEEK